MSFPDISMPYRSRRRGAILSHSPGKQLNVTGLLAGLLTLLSICLCVPPAHAASQKPLSLAELAARAVRIFHARVIDNTVQTDAASGQVVTLTRFEIIEPIKGATPSPYTIKQLGGRLPGSPYRLMVPGIPAFSPGKEYVVFLPEVSSLGFCSPLGLYQGRFDVTRIDGVKTVGNGRHYSGAATGAAARTGAVSQPLSGARTTRLRDFIATVQSLSQPRPARVGE